MAKGPNLAPGDKVTLNDEGLTVCFGDAQVPHVQHYKKQVMTVISVDPNSFTSPEPSHLVVVDDPFFEGMLITNWGFDKI